LLPESAQRRSGTVEVLGQDIFALDQRAIEDMRGAHISMIFQEPMTALNPTMTIGEQIMGVIQRHSKASRKEARSRAATLLADMHIRDVERVMKSYPFELSGGMRQRVLIAMAFSCSPAVLVADEPTTALDVTIQAQILSLLMERVRCTNAAVLLITHDMGVVREVCDRVYVMHAGQIVEAGEVTEVLAHPAHPYTHGLLSALPERNMPKTPLMTLKGGIGSLSDPPKGCRFRPRCTLADDTCAERPPLTTIGSRNSHQVACWHAGDFHGR
jgi:peptide/nickel transport system ATP-binding protein